MSHPTATKTDGSMMRTTASQCTIHCRGTATGTVSVMPASRLSQIYAKVAGSCICVSSLACLLLAASCSSSGCQKEKSIESEEQQEQLSEQDADATAPESADGGDVGSLENEQHLDSSNDEGLGYDKEVESEGRPENLFQPTKVCGRCAGFGASIWEDKIVYIDERADPATSLHLFNLTDWVETVLPVECADLGLENAEEARIVWPDINKERIAYTCEYAYKPAGSSDYQFTSEIHVYNLVSGSVDQLSTGSSMYKTGTWLEDRYVSWSEAHCGGCTGDVISYDLIEKKRIAVSAEDHMETSVDTDGSRVVYMKHPTGSNSDIMLFDHGTGARTQITNDAHLQFFSNIQGDFITWTDLRNGVRTWDGGFPGVYENSDIYAYRISTGETIQITENPANQELSDVHGELFVWLDLRHGSENSAGVQSDSELYVYDLGKRSEYRATDLPGVERSPKLFGTKLIWRHNVNGGGWLYDGLYVMDVSKLVGG